MKRPEYRCAAGSAPRGPIAGVRPDVTQSVADECRERARVLIFLALSATKSYENHSAQVASGADFSPAKRAFLGESALLKCTYQRERDYGAAASLSNGRAMAMPLARAVLAIFQTAVAGQHRTQCGGLTDVQALPAARHSEGGG